MKLFKRMVMALLAGLLAVGMLTGCAPENPEAPKPTDPEALVLYQGIADTCNKYNVKTPTYTAELDAVAKAIAEGTTINKYYTSTPKAVTDAAKAAVETMADGAAYVNYSLNLYEKTAGSPLLTSELKNNIVSKGANCIGISVVTLKNADGEDAKYACIVYARIPEAAAQN